MLSMHNALVVGIEDFERQLFAHRVRLVLLVHVYGLCRHVASRLDALELHLRVALALDQLSQQTEEMTIYVR